MQVPVRQNINFIFEKEEEGALFEKILEEYTKEFGRVKSENSILSFEKKWFKNRIQNTCFFSKILFD